MTTITAQSILASKGEYAPRIDTLLLRYPRCIHAELMTHRVFSRNAASSRAIPVEKLIQSIIADPFIPLFWGKNQKGMQASEECNAQVWVETLANGYRQKDSLSREEAWERAMWSAIRTAEAFADAGYHKQIVNRLLEPWMHITVVVTSTQWSNFLALRDHPAAEPHIQILAREVRKALDGADVIELDEGQWHLPFIRPEDPDADLGDLLKLSVARCASTSYKTVDGFNMTLEKAIELHDGFVNSRPLHASPFEHQAKVDVGFPEIHLGTGKKIARWCYPGMGGNLGPGWVQYRKTLENECL